MNSASSHFSFDQFNQDQVFYFDYQDENGRRRNGLTIADRMMVDSTGVASLEFLDEAGRVTSRLPAR